MPGFLAVATLILGFPGLAGNFIYKTCHTCHKAITSDRLEQWKALLLDMMEAIPWIYSNICSDQLVWMDGSIFLCWKWKTSSSLTFPHCAQLLQTYTPAWLTSTTRSGLILKKTTPKLWWGGGAVTLALFSGILFHVKNQEALLTLHTRRQTHLVWSLWKHFKTPQCLNQIFRHLGREHGKTKFLK